MKKITIFTLLALAATGTTRAAMRAKRQLDEPAPSKRVQTEAHESTGLSNALFNAARLGDTKEIERLLAIGAPINACAQQSNITPLYQAVVMRQSDAVRLLLLNGAHPHATNSFGGTPLHCAAVDGDCAIAQELLTHGADIHALTDRGYAPIHIAAKDGHAAMVLLLLDAGANPNVRSKGRNLTPLHFASWKGHTEVARILIERGAEVNALSDAGCPPLFWAKFSGHAPMIELLRLQGADMTMPGAMLASQN